jgi:hypothetical protein
VANVEPFTDEQARTLVNLEQHYGVWMAAERTLAELPYDLRRKDVGGRSYLYEIHDRSGNGRSLGPWSEENEAKFVAYREAKAAAKARREASGKSLDESARLCRALRVPMLASAAGSILREADRRRLLGRDLLVVGTNAMPAYAIEAGGFIREAPDETQDFDMAWSASDVEPDGDVVWRMLKSVDATFTVNSERPFQARNDKAYEVEILVAPSRAVTMSRRASPDRCRCRSRSGCCWAAPSTASWSAATVAWRVSWLPTRDGSPSRSCGCRGRPSVRPSSGRRI